MQDGKLELAQNGLSPLEPEFYDWVNTRFAWDAVIEQLLPGHDLHLPETFDFSRARYLSTLLSTSGREC